MFERAHELLQHAVVVCGDEDGVGHPRRWNAAGSTGLAGPVTGSPRSLLALAARRALHPQPSARVAPRCGWSRVVAAVSNCGGRRGGGFKGWRTMDDRTRGKTSRTAGTSTSTTASAQSAGGARARGRFERQTPFTRSTAVYVQAAAGPSSNASGAAHLHLGLRHPPRARRGGAPKCSGRGARARNLVRRSAEEILDLGWRRRPRAARTGWARARAIAAPTSCSTALGGDVGAHVQEPQDQAEQLLSKRWSTAMQSVSWSRTRGSRPSRRPTAISRAARGTTPRSGWRSRCRRRSRSSPPGRR